MKFIKKLAAVASAAALALSLTACGDDGAGTADEKIVIGIKFDQPGLGLKVGDGYEGFDVEVAKYVAKELGYAEDKIEFKESPSAQRENLIMGGQVKLIFATYSITDARKEKVSFAGPYFVAGQDLLVAEKSDITGIDALAGKKLCSVTGSTSAVKVKEKVPGVQLQEFDTYSKCVEALANGSIDAVTTDDVILAGYAAQDAYKGKLKVVGAPFSEERYGIGLKKGDTELCTKVNTAVQKMFDDGAWQAALEKTVGDSGYKIPAKPTLDTCS
ncbi:glutamate ABC transporter substrate-binding protein [Tessaracoccus sp. SD287]|uniref:glutamate ABC transporter substrate-binding protein n=1 Tax=Tessaracoccus sp. SD287 TaxID=2782008 RepID=UPI001A968DE7|nr:glutamate ABC transporter substrate-binding protein [Tessaracoccus sp. SD287]MBO1029853.1 glutamate ABC transporter substrate-binding protein [Tessaracoccus sp. SD287]